LALLEASITFTTNWWGVSASALIITGNSFELPAI
jgi:hypothetical protein